ncbi:hypothetical protein CWR48_00450 [Oceanobacillus arenosus]|uniref:Peptidase S8/S53 domain-containing protein n=1 Tax=Oceanobacillus arenosus TaxID=1229153 RepID=A0A3D8Q197_9BACI|nr:S8 family serine peptidase [Oceanobacillus arenosus]RDW22210.1 hypothetical protein CWR48_00450 [Oceanobacillus arenosus]
MGKNSKARTKRFSIIAVLLIVFSLLAPAAISAEANTTAVNKLSSSLVEQFENEEKVTFIVDFKEKANTAKVASQAKAEASIANLSAKKAELSQRESVINELKATANQSQANVKAFLNNNSDVEEVKSFHITNAIVVTATQEVAEEIAAYDEVSSIIPNFEVKVDEPVSQLTNELQNADQFYNVYRVKAPEVWEQGFNGEGLVVASIDSGVQWDHPWLKNNYRGFNAETGEVDHSASFFDAVNGEEAAYDDQGHGTHVTGTMVGTGEGIEIGVAPGAKFISAKALDSSNSGTAQEIFDAAQWILEPGGDANNAPDIVNNSWGMSGLSPEDVGEYFRDVITVWQDANIFPVFSAGNDGQLKEGTVGLPALYPEAFAVGATDQNDALAEFSSIGPSPYGETKPDVSAPGVDIISSYPGDMYGTASGTSMAAPAVSGVAALLLQANPDATVEELKNVLKETATPLTNETYTEVPNSGFGHGLVDALAAADAIAEQPEQPEHPAKEIERLSGKNRYETAIEVSQNGWADDSVDKVIVARGDDFSDALAGAPLAYAWDTPILLTPSDRMLDSTLAEIERLGAEEVYVLGGDIAVSKNAQQSLENAGYSVSRIKGNLRYDTAVAIAEELTDGTSEQVVIANGHNFPDALTIGSFAAQAGVPILLTKDSDLPDATANALTDLGVKQTLVVGGTQVVSDDVKAQLPNAERLSGSNRYGTNIAILEALGADVNSLYVATGTRYADALTGGVLAAKEGKGLVLVRDIVPKNISTYLSGKTLEDLTIFGGSEAVSDVVKEALEAILNK